MTTSNARRLGALASLAALLQVAPARAQAQDQASARALFNDARTLMKAGHYAEACPKLEAANTLFSGSGILLNLGDCYEHVGRTASAWTEFGEALSAAERAGRADDQAEARRRQAAIEPKLSRLTIHVAQDVPGLVVKRDGTALDRAAWGTAIPVDPGPHVVSAEASGSAPWSDTVKVTDPGKTVVLDVPALQTVASPPPAPVEPPPARANATPEHAAEAPSYWTTRRMAAAAITGVGVIGLGAGGIFGLMAKSKYSTAKGETGAARHDDSTSAVTTGNTATIFVLVGAGVGVAGAVLWLTAPSAPVQVGTNGTAVVLKGAF